MIRGSLARRAEQLAADRVSFVEAVVVRAERPTSVHPGDGAIVLADGTIDGFVGGICAEASVRLHALRVLETGEPLLLRLIPGDPVAAGEIDTGDGAAIERNPCLSGGSLEIFLEPRLPSPRLLVIGGAAPIARALAELAAAAGYDVVCGSSQELVPSPADAAVIVASHGNGEERALAAALTAGVPYVALVASAIRGEAVRAALELPDELRAQLHTPAGLRLGARSPHEVAIAILAEVVAERHAHPAGAGASAASATARDPICGMEVAVSAATIHLDADGERVYFCCEGCRAAYVAVHAGNARAAEGPICGLVLAAGSSSRLGRPKQLLPYGDSTLLEHVLEGARAFPFDELVCVVAAHAGPIREAVSRAGVAVVENPGHGAGCSSSIAVGLRSLPAACAVAVLMLGDQPGVGAEIVAELLRGRGTAPIAVCRYRDGRGHPLAFAASMFGELSALHGDRGVWRLLDRHAAALAEVPIAGELPRDVDTWADYEALLTQADRA